MKSLLELYGEHQGKVSDKWSIYLAEYDRLFSVFREQPVRMLEIGIQNGGSLEIWSKYFPNAQILVGCDINPDCAKLAYDDPRIQLVIGDANTDAVENEILSHSTNFDLIIDDGSHTSSDIAKSFARYFRYLNEGGLFVAEDLHCSYWREFEGGLYYPYSSMAFFKRLADVVNHEHWGIAKERRQLLRGFSEKFSIEFDEGELADIHSIEFFNSACVVRKLQAGSNVLGQRFIAGQHEFVVPGLRSLSGTSQTPSQASNAWAAMIPAPEEAWQQLTGELADRDSQISRLNQAVADRDEQITSLNEAFGASERKSSDQLASMVGRLAQETSERAEAIALLNQALAEREGRIASLSKALVVRDDRIRAIENSLSWRMTRPLARGLGRSSHLGVAGRRTAKLVWWTATFQLPQKMREWRLSRNVREVGVPHFAPPSDDYCFAVPFDYPVQHPASVPSVAVICHMYYPELLEEFKGYLSNIPFAFDFFITTDSEEKKDVITRNLADWSKGVVEVRLAQNRGRDIAPKLITCGDIYDRYEFFLHIHSKKSPHHEVLTDWRTYLLKTLLGSKEVVQSIFEAFHSDPNLGMIAPEHYAPVRDSIGWGWNFDVARNFARRMGLKLSMDGKIDFPSGSMFWGRSAAIKPLLSIGLTAKDFPLESSQIDGTLGHVIERLYFFVCEKAGYRWLKIGSPALLKKTDRILFIDNQASLKSLIKENQYDLLLSINDKIPSKIIAKLFDFTNDATRQLRLVHAKSDLHTMEFSCFRENFEKHIAKQESQIDFDENFYLSANPDVAEVVAKGHVSCGYVHYCLVGQYEGRTYSDRELERRFAVRPNFPTGFLAPVDTAPLRKAVNLSYLPQCKQPILLILFSHLQESLFFAGYAEFFKDYGPVFDLFDRVIIGVAHPEFDRQIAMRYLGRIEVMSLSEISSLKCKPSIIIGFNSHLTCLAHQMLSDNPERVVYYCQDFEAGFFPYGADYIIGEKAVAGSKNIIISTEILREFFTDNKLIKDQNVFVTQPKIEIFDVSRIKTNRIFFYYRPEHFNKRNLPETLKQAVYEFCNKYSGYEIYMVGSVATSYSFKINGTSIYIINKLPNKDYVELISSCDVVVSIIYAAHPGVIAYQAAASGIPTVTNVFKNRDSSLLKRISENIIPYDPVRDNLLDAIEQALAMPKGNSSFNEELYSGHQEESLAEFHKNILRISSQ